MSKFPDIDSIVTAVLQGIEEARKNFLFWTHDRLFLSHGPEKIIGIHVAQALAKIKKNTPEIFIDATIYDTLRCSLAKRDGFLEYMKRNHLPAGTFSITLDERFKHKNDNDSISRAIISIKKNIRNVKREYTEEIERICKMLDSTPEDQSTLNYGIFAFYTDLPGTARKKLKTRLDEIIESFENVIQAFPNLTSEYKNTGVITEKDIGEWLIGAYIIKRV